MLHHSSFYIWFLVVSCLGRSRTESIVSVNYLSHVWALFGHSYPLQDPQHGSQDHHEQTLVLGPKCRVSTLGAKLPAQRLLFWHKGPGITPLCQNLKIFHFFVSTKVLHQRPCTNLSLCSSLSVPKASWSARVDYILGGQHKGIETVAMLWASFPSVNTPPFPLVFCFVSLFFLWPSTHFFSSFLLPELS